jgi:hypothetical protein
MILSRRGRGSARGEAPGERFEPNALEDVLRRVVRPVVNGLVGPGDLEQLAVGWAPEPGRPRVLLVTLVARGAFWSTELWREGSPAPAPVDVATGLARELGAWIHAEAV